MNREELEKVQKLMETGDVASQYAIDKLMPKVVDTALNLMDENGRILEGVDVRAKYVGDLNNQLTALRERVKELEGAFEQIQEILEIAAVRIDIDPQPPEDKP